MPNRRDVLVAGYRVRAASYSQDAVTILSRRFTQPGMTAIFSLAVRTSWGLPGKASPKQSTN